MLKVVILVIGALSLITGCASYDSMYEVDYSQRDEDQEIANTPKWVQHAAWLRCDLSDVEYTIVEKQVHQWYLLVNCPEKGLKDVQCMSNVGGSIACIDSKGGIQVGSELTAGYFVY